MGIQTGWRLWKVKPLWNCRKIQQNHSYRDTSLWRLPVDLQRAYSLGHKQGREMFPEEDTNPATFVLTLKSFSAFFPQPKIPAFFDMAPTRLGWASPCPSACIPSTLSFTAAPLHASFQQGQTISSSCNLLCYFRSILWGVHSDPALVPIAHLTVLIQESPCDPSPLTRPPSFQCVLRTLLLRLSSYLTSFFLLCLLFQALKLRCPEASDLEALLIFYPHFLLTWPPLVSRLYSSQYTPPVP